MPLPTGAGCDERDVSQYGLSLRGNTNFRGADTRLRSQAGQTLGRGKHRHIMEEEDREEQEQQEEEEEEEDQDEEVDEEEVFPKPSHSPRRAT